MAYLIWFIITVSLLLFVITYQKTMDNNAILLIVAVALANGGYFALSRATSLGEAILAQKILYAVSFAPMLHFLIICSICKVNIPTKLTGLMYIIQTCIYASVFTIGKFPIFYKSISLRETKTGYFLTKVYGPLHTAYIATLAIYTIVGAVIGITSISKKNIVSRKDINILLGADMIVVGVYMVERLIKFETELIPGAFTIGIVMMMFPMRKVYRYSIATVRENIDNMTKDKGYIIFDNKLRFIGYNEMAASLYPELYEWEMEKKIPGNGGRFNTFLRQPLMEFAKADDQERVEKTYEYKGRSYRYQIGILKSAHNRKIGYVIWMYDITKILEDNIGEDMSGKAG